MHRNIYIYILVYSYSMVQSPSWEANWFPASHEIPRISRNPKVRYRTHKRPPLYIYIYIYIYIYVCVWTLQSYTIAVCRSFEYYQTVFVGLWMQYWRETFASVVEFSERLFTHKPADRNVVILKCLSHFNYLRAVRRILWPCALFWVVHEAFSSLRF